MSSTTLVDRRALLDDLADVRDHVVEPGGDLAQLRGSSRRGSRRARARSGRPRRGSSRRQRALMPPAPRRRGSRRASRRSRRRPRPSVLTCSCVVSSSAAASRSFDPAAAAVAIRVDGRDDARGRVEHAVEQARRRRERRRGAARRRRSTRGSSRPPLGDDRGLARDPGSAPRMMSNCALIALTAPARAGAGARPRRPRARRRASRGPAEIDSRPPADLDQRERRARRSTTTAQDDREDERGRAHLPSEPVGERVHVAVLDDGLVDDQREHGRGRLELRDVRGVRADLAGDRRAARRPSAGSSRGCRAAARAAPRPRPPRRRRSPARS